MKPNPERLVICVGGCLLAGILGSIFTTPAISTWYAGLTKPAFSPPNWVFGPAWTILYILMGAAVYLVWQEFDRAKGKKRKEAREGLIFFAGQFLLNVLWSFLFFGLRSPFYGLVGIVLLWLAIVLTLWKFYKVSKKAAWLLVPYILWVSFAGALNFMIWQMNP